MAKREYKEWKVAKNKIDGDVMFGYIYTLILINNLEFLGSTCGGRIFWQAQVGAADIHPSPGTTGPPFLGAGFLSVGLGGRNGCKLCQKMSKKK